MHGRHDRDAEINIAPFVAHAKASVLRHTPLGDVEFRHDLDARDERLMISEVNRINFTVERAVNAVFDLHFSVARFDVNV